MGKDVPRVFVPPGGKKDGLGCKTRGVPGWAAAFQEMAQRGDDALLDEAAPGLSGWDEGEWEWR